MKQYLDAMYAFEESEAARNRLRDMAITNHKDSQEHFAKLMELVDKLPSTIEKKIFNREDLDKRPNGDIEKVVEALVNSNDAKSPDEAWFFSVVGEGGFFDKQEPAAQMARIMDNRNIKVTITLGPILIADHEWSTFTSNSVFRYYIGHDESCNNHMYYSAYHQFMHWRIAYADGRYYIHFESPHGISEEKGMHRPEKSVNVHGTGEELKGILDILMPLKEKIESVKSSDPYDKNWVWLISGSFFPPILKEWQLREFAKGYEHESVFPSLVLGDIAHDMEDFCRIAETQKQSRDCA